MASTDPHSTRSFWWSLRGFFAAFGALATTAAAVVGLFLPKDSTPDTTNASVDTPPSAQQQPANPAPSPPPSPPPTPVSQPSPPPPPPPSPPPAATGAMAGEILDVQDSVEDPCCTFSVKISLTGFNGQDCTLTSTLINTDDGSETDGDEITLTPEAETDIARVPVAVYTEAAGTYRVRFVLLDPDGVELERFTTDPFDVG